MPSGLPRLMYVKVPAADREPRLADLLSRVARHSSYRSFRSPTELTRLVRDDLATLLSERFAASRADSAAPPRRRPLPVATTSLVGRDTIVDEVVALVADPAARLVTLTGPSGVGKTRLALAVAERVGDRFPTDRVFVSLAAVTQPDLALTNIGSRVEGPGGDSVAARCAGRPDR